MQVKSLYIEENKENNFAFAFEKYASCDIYIHFFDDKNAKMVNSYIEYPDIIDADIKNNQHTFYLTFQELVKRIYHYYDNPINYEEKWNIHLYLPKNRLYNFSIMNIGGKCFIENGNFHFLKLQSKKVFLENVEAKKGVILSPFEHTDIELINCNLLKINGFVHNLKIRNSSIYQIECITPHMLDIKDSSITYLQKGDSMSDNMAQTNISNSVIQNIDMNKTKLKLDDCHIQNIICKDSTIELNRCIYEETGYITLTDSTLNIENKEQYYTKKGFSNKMYLCDKLSKKKLIKVLNK